MGDSDQVICRLNVESSTHLNVPLHAMAELIKVHHTIVLAGGKTAQHGEGG